MSLDSDIYGKFVFENRIYSVFRTGDKWIFERNEQLHEICSYNIYFTTLYYSNRTPNNYSFTIKLTTTMTFTIQFLILARQHSISISFIAETQTIITPTCHASANTGSNICANIYERIVWWICYEFTETTNYMLKFHLKPTINY